MTALLLRLHHLTLTVACACLIVALQPMVPRVTPFLWPLAMLALCAGRLHERWLLPARVADGLALLATGGTLVWLYQSEDFLREQWVPLVPALGPLVLFLLVLRLYRSRERRDVWLLQGMGLLLVALACTLTTSGYFGLLLLLYLALALPLLAVAQLDEARRRAGLETVAVPRLGGHALVWTGAVFAGAMVLFLLAPRFTWQSWDPLQQLGLDPASMRFPGTAFNPAIDLNKTGEVNLGHEEAFRVYLFQGENSAGLPPDLRWRTGVLDRYQRGRWTSVPRRGPFRNPGQEALPALGDKRLHLRFIVSPRAAGGLVLAEPILFGVPPARLPVMYPDLRESLFAEANGTLLTSFALHEREYQYQQVTLPNLDRWPLVLPANIPAGALVTPLLDCPVAELGLWTRERLEGFASAELYGLKWATPLPEPGAVPANAELLARALTDYLALSPLEYTYTLKIARVNHDIDPVLDFLINVRQGHCERYAGALTLMLRSQGIPARIVRGFRGAEPLGEGFYIVYQSSAHAWVEALVPAGDGFEWIALDPTPAAEAVEVEGFTWYGLGAQVYRWQDALWRELIVGYGTTQQSALWQNWLATPGRLGLVVAVVGGVVLLLLVRRWLRGRTPAQASGPWASVPFLQRLWVLLARHGLLQFDASRTPRELATSAAAALADGPAAALADVPGRLVELFYRVRFGGVEARAEVRAAEAAVLELERVLLESPARAR